MTQYIRVAEHLPRFMAFIRQTTDDYQRGKFNNWADFRSACSDFYTVEVMNHIESVIPGWRKMASYDNQQTLVHVTSALVSLLRLPEYRTATPRQQTLMEWIVFLHDIEKRAHDSKRDHTHGFRSAAGTARMLPTLGFAVHASFDTNFESWFDMTYTAEKYDDTLNDMIQDNAKLPQIIDGIDQLFEQEASLIIKGILLHMSLTVVADWSATAPLSDDEVKAYITPELFPLLCAMMLADNDAWSLFEAERKTAYEVETRNTFARIEVLIEL